MTHLVFLDPDSYYSYVATLLYLSDIIVDFDIRSLKLTHVTHIDDLNKDISMPLLIYGIVTVTVVIYKKATDKSV